MTIAGQALLVTDRLIECLSKRNADIFNGVMRINMQITFGHNTDVQQAMPCDLIEHVIQKGQASIKAGLASTIQIQLDADLGFKGVANNFSTAHVSPQTI